ncbi:VanZ family protein [Bacillus sp. JJ722]|uniref:VanZ family protein n=1 Tax=Bacillus sp. JJ722 TaxID=3122973 RepID=UPI002FFE5E28
MDLVLIFIKYTLGYMFVLLPLYLVARFIYIKKKKKQLKLRKELLLILFVLYIVGLASQTILPKWGISLISQTGEFYIDTKDEINLLPLYTIYRHLFYVDMGDWGSNALITIIAKILLFLPLGFFIPLIWKEWNSSRKIFYLGVFLSFILEIAQLFIRRSADIDDVIFNTLGVIVGYGLYLVSKKTIISLRFNNANRNV